MISVVIPTYRAKKHILGVLAKIPDCVEHIIVVDDHCPEQSGQHVEKFCTDPRISIIYHPVNLGVGGATVTGLKAAIEKGSTIVIKLDSDGQMDPSLIPLIIKPIQEGYSDYTKGNRFYSINLLKGMPSTRLLGNAILSFMTKLSSGYWEIMDPTNGFIAIHAKVAQSLPLEKLSNRYFFESDMLFRLGTISAKVVDIPMKAQYRDEESNLSVRKVVLPFLFQHIKCFFKRILYNYFLRDFNAGTLELILGLLTLGFGLTYGLFNWIENSLANQITPTGTIIIVAISILTGIHSLIAFLNFDIAQRRRDPIYPYL